MVDSDGQAQGGNYLLQKRKLADRHVKVQEEWIEACIQWLSSETESSNMSPNQLHGLIYEQWLMSDLRDISIASLPANINSQSGTGILKGIYNLQVNYAFNIGVSAFSQLQNCKGLSLNDEHTEKSSKCGKDTPGASRPIGKGSKTTRTLYLELSDGCQTMKAIEYIPTPSIPDNTKPGLKIQLKGCIPYRDGYLLISPDNISILGGLAEELADEFTMENIFNKILSNGEVKDPLKRSIKVEEGSVPKTGVAAQNLSERKDANIPATSNGFMDEADFEELLQNEILTGDDIFSNEDFLEAMESANTNLNEKRVKSNYKVSSQGEGHALPPEVTEKTRVDDVIFLHEFLKVETPRTNRVKVYIVTFLSKLDVQRTSYKLTVCIDDGSAVAVATISSHVIEKLLGIPPMTIYGYKETSQPMPNSIKKAIVECEQRLATCIWQIQLRKNESEKSLDIIEMIEV